jgi:hypothetical protein
LFILNKKSCKGLRSYEKTEDFNFCWSVAVFLSRLRAEDKLAVKMSFGPGYGEKVEGQTVSTTGFFSYQAAEPEKAGLGWDFTLELSYQLGPNFGLALGLGFINKSMKGHTGVFTDDQVNMATF